MTTSSLQLTIPRDDDTTSTLYYLTCSSPYSFILEGYRWMSVEHYMLSKKFDNVSVSEHIRDASNITKARVLSREIFTTEYTADGRKERKKVYNDGLQIHPLFEEKYAIYIEDALRAKFSQNQIGRAHV